MKYLTKGWIKQDELSRYYLLTEINDIAEMKPEDAEFRNNLLRLFRLNGKNFVNDEKAEWFSNGNEGKFDYRLSVRRFLSDYHYNYKLACKFPNEITREVEDLRIMALGYVSEKVYNILQRYGDRAEYLLRRFYHLAATETSKTANRLSRPFEAEMYRYSNISAIGECNGGIYVKFYDNETLFVENGRIRETEDVRILKYNETDPQTERSSVKAIELRRNCDRVELHLLIDNLNRINRRHLWYFTASGTDIRKI